MNILNEISNHDVIPSVATDLFLDNRSSQFAVGIVAVGDTVIPGREAEHHGYSLLRGNVYALQKEYMPVGDLNADGTESDQDDARSIHFTIIENALERQRVVGAMRLIIKSRSDAAPLPIEEHYPEAFEAAPAPLMSTEVSRLICRHEDPRTQSRLKWPLFTAGVTYIMDNQLGPVFGAVEESLQHGLETSGVPVTPLAGGAKFVPEFNAVKLPIRIDINGLARKIEHDHAGLMDAALHVGSKFVYSGETVSSAASRQTVA